MSGKEDVIVASNVSIKNETCSSDGMGNCEVEADVVIVHSSSVTLMNDPTVKVGAVDATVTEPAAAVEDPPGTFTHTFKISAAVNCGQDHTITASAAFVVGVSATPVDVTCPN